jgi:hypothetical protein
MLMLGLKRLILDGVFIELFLGIIMGLRGYFK